jgi:ABC-2 type transport system ATP-binding protein
LILDEPGEGLDPEGIHEMRETILRLHRELKLTILLSSHLLSEVEQLCTRIAVLNQGQKVFEGSLAETKRSNQWVRLRVNDFSLATKILTSAGLISSHREGEQIELAANVETDAVVRKLVEQGVGVYEIAREAKTLESFYLSLMRETKSN